MKKTTTHLLFMMLMAIFPLWVQASITIQPWGTDARWPFKFTTTDPGDGWEAIAYDDATQTEYQGPIATKGDPNGTDWTPPKDLSWPVGSYYSLPSTSVINCIWVYTYFDIQVIDPSAKYIFEANIDDSWELWLNGIQISANENGEYELSNINVGRNTLAIKYTNDYRDIIYIDYSITAKSNDWFNHDDGWWKATAVSYSSCDEGMVPKTDSNGKQWYETGYDTSDWSNIQGPLGRDAIAEGGRVYLRSHASIDKSTLPLVVRMNLNADDYAEVYLNGKRVGEGGVGSTLTIPYSYFVDGDNLLAIRIDDNGGGDAYLSFDFEECQDEEIDFTDENGVTYHGIKNGTTNLYEFTVTGYEGTASVVSIPNDIHSNPVVAIGDDAFSGHSEITNVTIPENVATIGERAFLDCSLSTITVDASNTAYESPNNNCLIDKSTGILMAAATGCVVPATVTGIAHEAFGSTTEVTLQSNTPLKWAYDQDNGYDLTRLTIYIPNNLDVYYDYVDKWPWANMCFMLTGANENVAVTVSAQSSTSELYEKLGEANMPFITSLTLHGTINSYDIMLIRNKMVRLKHLDLSDVSIVYNEYEYYTGYCSQDNLLTSNAFCELDRLQTIKLPRTITGIEADAFANTPNLREVVMYEGLEFIDDAFDGTSIDVVTIPYSVTDVRDGAFQGTSISQVTFAAQPEGVAAKSGETRIGNSAFESCGNLEKVILNEGITTIGNSAFESCGNLEKVILNEGITTIGQRAFSYCDAIEEITIPYSVREVGKEAFYNYRSSEEYGIASLRKVTFSAQPEGQGAKTGETVIGERAFAGCRSLHEVIINEGVTTIGYRAFSYCDAIEEIAIPYSVGHIDNAFTCYRYSELRALQGLKKVTFAGKPEGAIAKTEPTYLADNLFNSSYSLEEVVIDCENIQLGSSDFANCTALTTVTMAEGITRVSDYAFSNCSALESIEIPYSVTEIANNAFEGSALKTVRLSAKMDDNDAAELSQLERIGSYAFSGCQLEDIVLPDRLEYIEDNAFSGNSNLTTVHLPSSVKTIGESAFADCSNIKNYYVKWITPHKVEMHTFSNYQTAVLNVPNKPETTRDLYYWNTEWSKFLRINDTYAEGEEPNYEGSLINFGDDDEGEGTDYQLPDGDRIPGKADMNQYPYAGFIVEGTDVQPFGEVHLISNGTDGASMIDQGNISIDNLFFDINVEAQKWYFLSFPFDVKLTDVTAPGRYVFRYYDGVERAQMGSGGWKNLPNGQDKLEAGKGYIFQCESIDDDEDGDGLGILSAKAEKATFDGQQKDLTLKTYISDGDQDASWNLLSNPYPSYYNLNKCEYDAPVTIWNGEGYDSYRPGDDNYILHPYEAFFVQKPTDVAKIQFPLDGRLTYKQSLAGVSSMPKRKVKGDVTRQFINLTLSSDTHTDRTRVVFNETKNAGYDLGDDAAKFITNAIPQLYTLDSDGTRYAISERPFGEVAIGIKVPQTGTYTISAQRMDQPMLMLDKVTGQYIDLMAGDYQFEAKSGTTDDRFVLVGNNGADGIVQLYQATGVSLTATDGGLNIVGNGQDRVDIYNANGALVGSHTSDGFAPLQKGVYVVKVNDQAAKVMVK